MPNCVTRFSRLCAPVSRVILVAVAMTSILTTLAAGCTQSTSPRVPESNKSREAPNSLFNYKVNEITELTLGKFDPATSEHWMTVIKRTDAALKKRANTATWEIISLPDGNTTRDRKANATFIMHLLDSLQGLRVVGDAPNGSLESLGLDPPRFVVRLKTNSNIHEFRIGTLSDDKLGNYFTTDQKKVIIASGSALKMLPMIKNFEYLRDRSWTPFSPDDVDEFILSDQGKPFFYAQREGSQWNDKNHRPITFAAQNKFKESARQDAESLLKTLTEIQPLGFIDDPVQVEEIKSRRSILLTYEAKLINRHGTEVSLKLVRSKKKVKSEMNQTALYGLSSTRPSTLFILDPKILTAFENSKALQPQHN